VQKKNGFNFSKTLKPDKMISQIMVKFSPCYVVDTVASLIGRRVKKTISVKTKTMTSEIANNLLSLEKIILLLSIFICVLCFSLLLVISLLVTGIRKKEFAILRSMGASRKKLLRIVALEQFLLNASASFFAIFFTFLCVFPFRFAIQNLVSLPFLFPNFLTALTLAIFSFLFSIIISSFSASFSAYKISKIDSASILRET
ncbi:MAG: FtsX-like permease family protein, partial [Treponema sp.]|nr:FtsX-like permease family protein [Treponema sp.]